MQYQKMQQKEWDKATRNALTRFTKEILGIRPTRGSASRNMYNSNPISILEWLGVMLLLAIGVVTAYKLIPIAFSFAASFYPATASSLVVQSFGMSMAVVFILLSTSGLVYTKLMDEYDPEIMRQKVKHPRLKFSGGIRGAALFGLLITALCVWALQLDIETTGIVAGLSFIVSWYLGGLPTNLLQYGSPRLYGWLTYLIFIWLLFVSSRGDGSFFERYLMVFAEFALTYLVANLIIKQADWQKLVTEAYTAQSTVYDSRLKAYQSDPDYLQILYRELREVLTYIERRGRDGAGKLRKNRPNLFMETAEGEIVNTIIVTEYQRNTGGQRFSALVLNRESIQAKPQAQANATEKRIPPLGDKKWTVNSLTNDFIMRGLKPSDNYGRTGLTHDYQATFNARPAWHDGAKEYFNG